MTSAVHDLERVMPSTVGVRSRGVLDFLSALDSSDLEVHSLMVLRHGKVAAEGWWFPYQEEYVHILYSLSKSFTSTAIGFAVSEGLVGLDDRIVDHFPEDVPDDASENPLKMRVRDVLSMATGHSSDPLAGARWDGEESWERLFLSAPVEHEPGTHFVYNNSATYMLSSLLQRRAGMTVLEYLRPRLLDPIGIESANWTSNNRGINHGAFGLSITTESIARLGLLYLQDGVWEGRRVLPEGWVSLATSAHVSNGTDPESDWAQGYGFQFWRSKHGAYRGDGAFGQNCIVIPDKNAVVVTTGGVGDLQALLNLVWEHLLPAMSDEEVAADPDADLELRCFVESLALDGPTGARTSARAESIAGGEFISEDGRSVRFSFAEDQCSIVVRDAQGEHRVVAGLGDWLAGETSFDTERVVPVAVFASWPEESTLVVRIQYTLDSASSTLTFRFAEDGVNVQLKRKATFRPGEEDWGLLKLRG